MGEHPWPHSRQPVIGFLRGIPRFSQPALCAETDPELFWPEKGDNAHDAKRLCRSCPVREECLRYAIENQVDEGIWGGLSAKDRKRISVRGRVA